MKAATASLLVLAFAATATAWTSTLQDVENWGGPNPTNLTMQLYVPTTVQTNRPPVVLALHWCTGNGYDFFRWTEWADFADELGFIVIYPTATRSSHCWDVASPAALTHNGGSDTLTVANMVSYVHRTYKTDPERTFVSGHSSGGMMTQAMIGAYPNLFAAGASFAGVPFGCFATTDPSLWNSDCATGMIDHTAREWGAIVKAAYPGYRGARPRVQMWHGELDDIVSFVNFGEAIEEWTNVHGVRQSATTTDSPDPTWTRTRYGKPDANGLYPVEGVAVQNGTHNVFAWGMVAYCIEFFGGLGPC